MKIKILFLAILLGFHYPLLAQKVSLFDELIPLYPDTPIKKEAKHIRLHAAKGTILSINILIRDTHQKNLIDIQHNFSGLFRNVEIYKLIDVPVEENTGLDSRTEQYTGQTNPYVIRKAPFYIYEVLQPVKLPVLTEQPVSAFNIQWEIPKYLPEGEYNASILIKGNGFSKLLQVSTVVHKAAVPRANYNTYKYTNWFSLNNIASYHGVEKWSSEFWNILQKYALKMARGRQNVFWITLRDVFHTIDQSPVLDKKNLKKLIATFTKAGIYYIEFAPIAHRTNGDWSSKTLSSNFDRTMLVNSDRGYAFYEKIFSQLKHIIEENNWQGRSLFHIADEPTDEVVEDYTKFTRHLKKYFPNSPILEASMTLGLSNIINNWCPQVQEYQKHKDFFENRKIEGDKVWVYTCLIPGGQWLNRLLDQHKLRQVYIGWSLAKFDLEGYLHWGFNHYNTKNPFSQSVVDHPQAPNTRNKLPAGDTHIIYPGNKEPWGSLRFLSHRIGMEDAELFKKLKKDKRKNIMKSCFKAFDDYKTNVELYRQAKQELLEELDNMENSK